MKIEISGYTLTNDSGDKIVLSVEEYDKLTKWFTDDSLPLPLRTTNSPSIYLTQSPSVPPDPTPPGEPLS